MDESFKIKRGIKDYCKIFVLINGKIGVVFPDIDKLKEKLERVKKFIIRQGHKMVLNWRGLLKVGILNWQLII